LYELLYLVSGLENADKLVRIELNDTVKGQSGSTLLSAEADWVLWPKVDFCYSAVILCEPETEKGDVAFLVGSDLHWKTDTTMEDAGAGLANTSTNGPHAMISSPIEKGGKTTVAIAHNVADQQVRAIAVDTSGVVHKPIGTSATFAASKGMGMMNVEFDLPLAEIKSLQFQTQKFQPVTFKNVALRHGVKTEVEIPSSVSRPPASEEK
jgi:hypothetical protein